MYLQNDIKINEYSVLPDKISEKDLNKKNTLLSFSIYQDEIEYAIIDVDTHSVYATANYSSTQKKFSSNEVLFLINDFIHRYHLHQYTYKHVHVLYSSPHFTFCPSEFYLPDKKDDLLRYVHPLQPNEGVHVDSFENIKIIYSIPQNLYSSLLQIFPAAKISHTATAMLNIFFSHPVLVNAKIWATIHPNYIEIIAKNNKQFLFYNTFDVQTSLDILYYLMFCTEQLQLQPKDTDIYLSGNLSNNHTIFQITSKYFHTVQIVHHHPKLHVLPIHSSLISHYHFITFNHHLCVLYQENTRAEK